MEMSRNCATANKQGKPNRQHVCTGCPGCPCHHRRGAPIWFRALVEEARAAKTSSGPSGGEAGGPDDTPGGVR